MKTTDKIYQNALEINSMSLQIIAWINEIRSKQDQIVAIPTRHTPQQQIKEISASPLLTDKEITEMPKPFNPTYKVGKITAKIRLKQNGTYEIRCCVNGQNFSSASTLLADAKKKFAEKLKAAVPQYASTNVKTTYLEDYMRQWLETVKKPYIKEDTYKRLYLQVFNAYIIPNFGKRDIKTIKPLELQTFINSFTEAEKFRTAQKLQQVLSALFDYAVTDEIISRSPMAKVKIGYYEQKHGIPLTRSEEKEFIQKLKDSPTIYAQAFAFILYTGLRRSELASAVADDKWVTVTTAKQRKGKSEKIRRIPISPMLKSILPLIDVEKVVKVTPGVLTKRFKMLFPNHHLHDLRHTFITRCQECGIQREIVSLWAGHAADSSITSTVYTHLEQYEDNQLTEIQKFSYIL